MRKVLPWVWNGFPAVHKYLRKVMYLHRGQCLRADRRRRAWHKLR
jgi:hypothetical protein